MCNKNDFKDEILWDLLSLAKCSCGETPMSYSDGESDKTALGCDSEIHFTGYHEDKNKAIIEWIRLTAIKEQS
jgi:hypothetical protein